MVFWAHILWRESWACVYSYAGAFSVVWISNCPRAWKASPIRCEKYLRNFTQLILETPTMDSKLPYQPPAPDETMSMPPNYRAHGDKKKKKRKVKLYVGDNKTKPSAGGDVELYDILQALRVEDMIRIRVPSVGKNTVVTSLYDYSMQRTKNFRRGDIFWLPPKVVPVEDSLYGDLCQCLDILQDSSIVQDSPEERWDKDEMLMEYQDRIDIEMEFMKPLLILDYSLITFVSADAQTGFERFLSHLMITCNAKIIKIETSSSSTLTGEDPLSGQSQSTGESTNSSSEALTEIIRFLEEEEQREQQRKPSSDRSAMSSLAYSEGSTNFANSESGATIGSATTVDSSSLLAGTKLVGNYFMEENNTTEHRATIDNDNHLEESTSFGEGEPSSEGRFYMRDDYTTPPSSRNSKPTRSIASKNNNNSPQTSRKTTSPMTVSTPPRQEDYANNTNRLRGRSRSYNKHQLSTNSTLPKEEDYESLPTSRSRSYNSHESNTPAAAGSPNRSEYRLNRSNRSHTSHNSNSRKSPRRIRKNRKRQVEEDEESYFSQSSRYESPLLCGLDLGDAGKSLRRFFCL